MDLGQVFTTKEVADYMVSLFRLESKAKILDPCFGEGAFLKALQRAGYTDVSGYEIDVNLFQKVQRWCNSYKIFCGDFLSVKRNILYDGIIMNPPYIRQEKIDALEPLGVTKTKIRKDDIYRELPAAANLYMYFVLKAIDLLKEGGELIVIFPSSWMQARSGLKFKREIESNCVVEEEVYIKGTVFEKEALVEVVILKLCKGKKTICSRVIDAKIQDGRISEQERETNYFKMDFRSPFSELAVVRRGLTTGCNELYINPEFKEERVALKMTYPIVSSPKNLRGFSTTGAILDDLFVPDEKKLLESNKAQEYLEFWKVKIFTEGKPKTLCEKIKREENWYQIHPVDSRGIWFSYFVRNDMKFILNTEDYFARDNFYIISPKIDEFLMLALLNNFYTFYQLEKMGKKYGAGLLKLQRYDIQSLRFPEIEKITNGDCKKLQDFAKKLIVTGDRQWITEITKVVSGYSEVSDAEIQEQYEMIRQKRLKGEIRWKSKS